LNTRYCYLALLLLFFFLLSFVNTLEGDESGKDLSQLKEEYVKAEPGKLKNRLAKKLHQLMSTQHWKDFSGNAHGILVLIHVKEQEDSFHFTMTFEETAQTRIRQSPQLILSQGHKEKAFTLPPPENSSWQEGWYTNNGDLKLEIQKKDLAFGHWQALVKGSSKLDGFEAYWSSESFNFSLPKAKEEIKTSTDPIAIKTEIQKPPVKKEPAEQPSMMAEQEEDNKGFWMLIICLFSALALTLFWKNRRQQSA
jgi:hypothetical protein